MSFFHQLYNHDEPLHITLDIMKMGDKLIIAVTPHSKTALRHVQLTGTPGELADGFFDQIKLPEGATGLQVNDLPTTDSKEEKPSPAKIEKPANNKGSKPRGKEKPAATKAPKEKPLKGKQAPPVEQSMFDVVEEPAGEEPTDEEVDDQLTEETE